MVSKSSFTNLTQVPDLVMVFQILLSQGVGVDTAFQIHSKIIIGVQVGMRLRLSNLAIPSIEFGK